MFTPKTYGESGMEIGGLNDTLDPAVKMQGLFSKLKNAKPVAGIINFAKAHPYQTAGLGILGAGNIAGLFDNDKFGGQLGGAALGAVGSGLMHAAGVSGVPLAWAPLAGGAIGALWDVSRAAKEKEEAQRQQMLQSTY